MRVILRIIAAHILACLLIQSVFIVWALIDGQRVNSAKGAIAVVVSPILIPLPILRVGPRMRPIGYAVYCILYVVLPGGCFLLLQWRAALKRLSARRAALGLCSACGYSLNGNTSGVCPECGTDIPHPPITLQ